MSGSIQPRRDVRVRHGTSLRGSQATCSTTLRFRWLRSRLSPRMSERRTVETNWRVREAVGIRAPRPQTDYGARVLADFEEELRLMARDQKDQIEDHAPK